MDSKTVKQTAEIFGVHRNTIRNWIKYGTLKAYKVHRTIRIPQSEIDKLLGAK